jgi:two-component system chemotaxis response regulator CheB
MEALQKVVSRLPAGLPAALFVAWHMAPGTKSVLAEVLAKAGPLPAVVPGDGDPIEPGRIYVAPNDHHMLLERGYIRVTKGPKENRFRPALDPLFRSAAYVYGTRVIGVVLSGGLDDGTSGLWTIRLRGGTAIVQEPSEAQIRSMPLNALENVEVDHKLPAAAIGELLGQLTRERAAPLRDISRAEQEKTEGEIRIAEQAEAVEQSVMAQEALSPFTCPECHGALGMIREGRIVLRHRAGRGEAVGRGARARRSGDAPPQARRGVREGRRHGGGRALLRQGAGDGIVAASRSVR